jgi:hypothetical protein
MRTGWATWAMAKSRPNESIGGGAYARFLTAEKTAGGERGRRQ